MISVFSQFHVTHCLVKFMPITRFGKEKKKVFFESKLISWVQIGIVCDLSRKKPSSLSKKGMLLRCHQGTKWTSNLACHSTVYNFLHSDPKWLVSHFHHFYHPEQTTQEYNEESIKTKAMMKSSLYFWLLWLYSTEIRLVGSLRIRRLGIFLTSNLLVITYCLIIWLIRV